MSLLPALDVHGGAILNGDLLLTLEGSENWTDEATAAVTAAMYSFLAVGALGGYRGIGPGTSRSSLTLSVEPKFVSPSLQIVLAADNVSPLAFQYIRQMIGHLDLTGAAVNRILILQKNMPVGQAKTLRCPPIDDANEGDMYPAPISTQPFVVTFDESPPSKHRRFLVELSNLVGNEDVEQARAICGLWGALLEGGAFSLPVGMPDEIDSVMGFVSQLDASSLEVEVPVYRASEAGWDVLINLLATTKERRILNIVAVTIE
jgi:hypothetical protein